MALVDIAYKEPGTQVEVDVRGRRVGAEVVKLPFYKRRRMLWDYGKRSKQGGNKNMNVPKELMYTKSMRWVKTVDDTTVTVGLTDYAQDALGDLVFVNLPEPGDDVTAGEAFSDVESGEGSIRCTFSWYLPARWKSTRNC